MKQISEKIVYSGSAYLSSKKTVNYQPDMPIQTSSHSISCKIISSLSQFLIAIKVPSLSRAKTSRAAFCLMRLWLHWPHQILSRY